MPRLKRSLRGFSHSSHCVAIKDDGTFYADWHDFHPDGPGDFAVTVYVTPENVPMMRSRLEATAKCVIESDAQMLDVFASTFQTSTDVERWLEAEAVPFKRKRDTWELGDPDRGP